MNIVAQKLPPGWTTISLKELIARTESINPSRTPGQKYELWSVPAFEGESPEYVVGAQVGSNKQRVTTGDVLLCKINPRINRVWLVWGKNDFEQIASTEWVVLRYEGLVPKFIMHQLREGSFRRRLCANASGVGGSLTRARPRVAGELELNIAPVNEQKRIVTTIEKLQLCSRRAREALETVPSLLEQLRQSILAAACSGRLTADWRNNHTNTGSSIQLSDVNGDLPNSWAWKSMQDLADSAKGSIQSGPFGSNLLHSEFQPTGILAIGIDNVLDGKFSLGRQHRISSQKYEMLKKYTAHPLDVLVTVMATVGRCCVVPADTETAIITKHVYRIAADQQVVNPHYLMQCIRGCPTVLAQLQGGIQGMTRPGINGSILKEVKIPLPPLVEQHEIVQRVEGLFALADQIEARFTKAKARVDQLTQSILGKAFRGELVPQDPNDELASVLLERIKAERTKVETEGKGGGKKRLKANGKVKGG